MFLILLASSILAAASNESLPLHYEGQRCNSLRSKLVQMCSQLILQLQCEILHACLAASWLPGCCFLTIFRVLWLETPVAVQPHARRLVSIYHHDRCAFFLFQIWHIRTRL